MCMVTNRRTSAQCKVCLGVQVILHDAGHGAHKHLIAVDCNVHGVTFCHEGPFHGMEKWMSTNHATEMWTATDDERELWYATVTMHVVSGPVSSAWVSDAD